MSKALLDSFLASLRSRFVDDLKAHLKRYSLWMLAALLAIQPVWLGLDDAIKGGLPNWFTMPINMALAAAGIIGALLKQDLNPAQFGLEKKETPDA